MQEIITAKLKLSRVLAVLVAAGTLALAAACGSTGGTSGTSGSSGSGQAPASSPAAPAAWHVGGTYTGPVPPAGLLGPTGTWQLNPYTSPDGYRVKDSIIIGVPLHYAIPNDLVNCYTIDNGTHDLPPGQFVVPFEIYAKNLTNQESRVLLPQFWAGDANGNPTIDVTSGDQNGNDTNGLYANGDCNDQLYHNFGVGGTDAFYGVIGPATPQQLADTTMYVTWDPFHNDGGPPQLSLPLAKLLPHQGQSWLVAETGKPIPGGAPVPAASPTSCPSPPANYTQAQQVAFNTGCSDWLGQIDEQLQWDNGNPAKAEHDWCFNQPISYTDSAELTACIAGTRAAGAP